ncbi:MAG: AAA family ATPase [Burkholderiaceae bacterium]|nr:AAA family ATPase [Burkholderiaceae bacterium]
MDSSADPAAAARAAAHAEVVAQLRRPGACGGHPAAAGLIETHLSSLLLAGDRVYKLKKPVAFPFVDFSTAALRRQACEQELRLNRRTAPQWYLAVVAVRQGEGGAAIAAPGRPLPGPAIDWAVQMRRFDDRQLFDRLAGEGRLDAAQVDRLAGVVAAFHAAQPPLARPDGVASGTCAIVRDNASELAALAAGSELGEAVAGLQRWSEARGKALSALMDRRAREGHVRDGHGDLHLGNIVWADGTAVLFDALEFDDRLRQSDTVGDLAFTFMDLQAHGLPRLAWRFVGAVLEAGGEWSALPLLAWWAVHRALVRAKVALLARPAIADADADADARAQARARHYLDLAAALAAPPAPRLLLMMGLSGSGKTAVAGVLAECLGGVRLRSDVERKRLFGLAPTDRAGLSLGLYTAEATRCTYARLEALAADALRGGVSVVIDAASLRRDERDTLRALARHLGAPFHLVLCEAPDATLRERLARRQAAAADASDATTEVLERQQQFTEWPAEDEAAGLLRIATDRPWPALEQAVVQSALRLAAA